MTKRSEESKARRRAQERSRRQAKAAARTLLDRTRMLRFKTRADVSWWAEHRRELEAGALLLRRYVVRRGLWVRYLRSTEVLIRKVPVGTYGQISGTFGRRSNLCWVLWTTDSWPVCCDIESLEPLVGTPIGQPRDHLRKWLRLVRAKARVPVAEEERERREADSQLQDRSE